MLTTFSLDGVPASERKGALQASFHNYPLPISTRFAQVGDITARFASRSVGRVRMERFDVRGVGGTAVRRGTEADSAIEPAITLHVLDRGRLGIRHAERASVLEGGMLLFSTTGSPLAMTQHHGSAMSTITVPFADAGVSPRLALAGLGRPFRASDPVAATAVALVRRLARDVADDPEQSWEALEATLIALLRALVIVGAAPARDAARPLAETLTARVLHYIEEHALEASLDAAVIAAAHGISTRYLYVILRAADIALGDHVRALRLRHAERLLSDPIARHLTIAEIAYRSGFADHAHFSRSFRRGYDASPRAWRQARGEEARATE